MIYVGMHTIMKKHSHSLQSALLPRLMDVVGRYSARARKFSDFATTKASHIRYSSVAQIECYVSASPEDSKPSKSAAKAKSATGLLLIRT